MSITRFGIRARMFLAFGLIALVTVLSSTIAWLTYENLSNSLNKIAQKDIPGINLASELSSKSGEIVTTAPALIAAGSNRERGRIWRQLSLTIKKTEALVVTLTRYDIPAPRQSALGGQLSAVTSALRTLDTNVQRRFWFTKRNNELTGQLRWAHADFLDEIDPLILDTRFNAELLLRRLSARPNIKAATGIAQTQKQQQVLLQIKADVNLLVGLNFRAANADSAQQLKSIRLFAAEGNAGVKAGLRKLPNSAGYTSLRQSAKTILSFVDGENSLFKLRRDALNLQKSNAVLLENTAALVAGFQSSAGELADLVKAQAINEARQAGKITAKAKTLLVWASIGSILIAIGVVWFYVGRNLVGRVQRLSASMGIIADGDLAAPVPIGGDDEISDMAHALEVFRNKISNTQKELVQAGKLAALGQLAAGVAHDLNQPLAAIRFQAHNAGVLLQKERGQEARQNLEKIAELSGKMAQKINHLKTLARKPSQSISDVDLQKIISSALDLLQGRIRSADVKIVQQLPSGELLVRGGENRLEQVFLNIFANALDAVEGHGDRQVLINAKRHDEKTIVTINDSGQGMSEAQMAQIFDPFFTTKEIGKGLGLGLSISYNIIKDFGGSLSVESVEGSGTTFSISLNSTNENR